MDIHGTILRSHSFISNLKLQQGRATLLFLHTHQMQALSKTLLQAAPSSPALPPLDNHEPAILHHHTPSARVTMPLRCYLWHWGWDLLFQTSPSLQATHQPPRGIQLPSHTSPTQGQQKGACPPNHITPSYSYNTIQVHTTHKWYNPNSHFKTSTNHTFPVDLPKHFSPRQSICGYLHATNATEIMQEIETLSNLAPKEVAEDSRFLLEITFTALSGFHIKAQNYWILAVNAAHMARDLELARGTRTKWAKQKVNAKNTLQEEAGHRQHQAADQKGWHASVYDTDRHRSRS